MTVKPLRYDKEEFAQRGKAIYESQIRPQMAPDHHGKIVAIDIETGAFELGENSLVASDQLLAHHPEAQIWFVRVGHAAVHRLGYSGEISPQ
jgi:mannose-6-phosphate isomerase-like protein (cupin superfamily)